MQFQYHPKGVCSRKIDLEIDENGILHHVRFTGGCNGNLQGISSLVEGQPAQEVVQRLSGICCGFKSTSCPDQLAAAIEQALQKIKAQQVG